MVVQDNQKKKVDTKNKMDDPRFVDDETITLVQGEDFDEYNTQDTCRVYETSSTDPDVKEAASTLQLRQKVKRDKLTALYRHLNVTGGPGLADIVRIMLKKIQRQATLIYFFLTVNIGNLSLTSLPVNL